MLEPYFIMFIGWIGKHQRLAPSTMHDPFTARWASIMTLIESDIVYIQGTKKVQQKSRDY